MPPASVRTSSKIAAVPRIMFHLLGAPRIEINGVPIEVDTRKAIALAIFLAVTGEVHRRERLAGLFWPEADEAKASAALRRTLSVLNKALATQDLVIDRETVQLKTGGEVWADVDAFHQQLHECARHGHSAQEVCAACARPLAEAAALYRADFLAGFTLRDSPAFDDWQFFQSETLRRKLTGALERLVKCYSVVGDWEAAVTQARRWLALDPLHEPAHRQLMTLYGRTGQRPAALRQYQECVRILNTELGVPPLEETTRLYEAIKANQSKTDSPPDHFVQGNRQPVVAKSRQPSPQFNLDAQPGPPTPPPLVGRSHEWEALRQYYHSLTTAGMWVVLEGEAGIGKTRLAEAYLAYLRERGVTVLTARCYDGEFNLAYGSFVEALRSALSQPLVQARLETLEARWLSEAARLLPELADLRPDLPPSLPLDSPGAQSRFFDSLTQILLALGDGQPTLVFLDDIHWIDEASLDLLTYLVRRLRGQRLMILVTWRTEDVPVGHRLRLLLAEAQRAGNAERLGLSRLDPPAVEELIQATLHPTARDKVVERLFRETEGLPLFLVEYLATLQRTDLEADWPLPIGVRGLLQARLRTIDEAARQLLSTAAVIGRSFDFDTLQAASGRSDEETVTALEALLRQGLVQEVNSPSLAYDFSHDKLRALVYDETSLARRQLLHRRVAEALAAQTRGQTPLTPLANQIALHYRLGGRNTEAAHFYQLAGEYARQLYANTEALAHFRAALALGHNTPATLHEAIGDLQTLAGEYNAALISFQTAAAHGVQAGSAELEHKMGIVYERRGDSELAKLHFEAALDVFGPNGSAGGRARVLADWSLAEHHRGQIDQAFDLARQSLALAEAGGDQHALAQAHNILGILASSRQDLTEAQNHLQHSLTLAEALGDASAQVAALNNLALAYSANDQDSIAINLTERALALCVSQGDRHREAALHNHLADLLHALGQADAAMSHLKQAVALFAEIGLNSSAEVKQWQPEIWKLTEW